MPNHITNVLELDCSDERFAQIAKDMKGSYEDIGEIDFNVLIPMPEALNIVSGSGGNTGYDLYRRFIHESVGLTDERKAELERSYKKELSEPEWWDLGKQYYENEQNYGSKTWYEWCNAHWGTKWNAYDCECDEEAHVFTFLTAWDGVPELIRLMSEKYPDVSIVYKYADEDIGYNVGMMCFVGGKQQDEFIPEEGSPEACKLAAQIRGSIYE